MTYNALHVVTPHANGMRLWDDAKDMPFGFVRLMGPEPRVISAQTANVGKGCAASGVATLGAQSISDPLKPTFDKLRCQMRVFLSA